MQLSGDMLFQALINGFTLGWVYVLMALGLTFIMSMARILQLAHGEVYMLGAYVALFLTTSLGLNFYLALVLSMLIMGLLGFILERFIFRWVSGQFVPPIVISSGLTLMLTSIAVVYFGLYTRSVPRLANGSFVIGGASFAKDKAIVVGITVVLLAATLVFLKESKYGKAMVATAQNREGALLRGIRSNRVASMSFAIASALAGAAGALAGALFQVSPFMGTAPLTKGIVIIVLGGLGSFPGAVVGGLILGLLDGVLPVMFNPLVTLVVPLVIVILILLFRPKGLFGHETSRLVRPAGLAVVIVLAFCLPLYVRNYYLVSVAALALINIMLVYSIRSVTLIGFFSLGQVGFALIGAYASALLVMKAGFPMWLGILAGAVLAALVALVMSYPFLKVKGMYFAILTLLAAETLRNIAYYWKALTGGAEGLTNIPSPAPIRITDGLVFDFSKVTHYYYVIVVACVVSLYLLHRLERSHLNHRWRAVNDSEELAGSVGINTAWYKVLCFTFAGFFAGLAGAVFAFNQHNLSADAGSRFGVVTSLTMVIYMVVGGGSRFSGPILGTVLMMVLAELSRPLQEYQNWLIGAVAIVLVILLPDGLVRSPERVRRLWARIRSARPVAGGRPRQMSEGR